MSAPRKAVFARSQHQARSYAKAFDLSPEEWSSFGISAAIPRNREFETMVVILPPNVTSREFAQVQQLHALVAKGGSIALLSPNDELFPTIPATPIPGVAE